jgi:hypothetical protein
MVRVSVEKVGLEDMKPIDRLWANGAQALALINGPDCGGGMNSCLILIAD